MPLNHITPFIHTPVTGYKQHTFLPEVLRETERNRERDTRYRDTDRHTERETETDIETDRETDKERETETEGLERLRVRGRGERLSDMKPLKQADKSLRNCCLFKTDKQIIR